MPALSMHHLRGVSPIVANSSEKRVTLNLNVSPAARAVMEGIRADTGVPITTAVERFLDWMSNMPRKFRLAILQGDEEGQQELLTAWFKETMHTRGKSVEVTEGDDVYARLRLAHQILEEVEIAFAQEKVKNTGSTGKVKKK